MKVTPKIALIIALLAIMILMTGCTTLFSGDGKYIISATEALRLSGDSGVVIVDAQKSLAYNQGHLEGAVNITRSDIVIDDPVPNMLLPQAQFEELMSRKGIANDSLVIIYDSSNNMDAARLWWTLKVYGHTNAKVVNGGLLALLEAGAERTKDDPVVTMTEYTAQPANKNLIASIDEVIAQVNNPAENVIILDTRTQEEFDAGAVPGAVLVNYVDNHYYDGTIKSVQAIKLMYRDKDIRENDTIILYCKSSIRAAHTFLALHNAGYENLKVFDGGWLEWSADDSLPVQLPCVKAPVPGTPDEPEEEPGSG